MISRSAIAACLVGMAITLGSSGANATAVSSNVYFTITSDTEPTITFTVPLSPIPDIYDLDYGFTLDNVSINVGGTPGGTDTFMFYNSLVTPGLSEQYYFGPDGIETSSQLYSGTEQDPTFIPGTYYGTYVLLEDPDATIVISQSPLPSTWVMMLSGILGFGSLIYRRCKPNFERAAVA